MTHSNEEAGKSLIKDLSSHTWRTELPQIIEGLGLDPYEYRLYGAYKSAAGDSGGCWKSNNSLARLMKIGVTKLKEVKKSLQAPRAELGGLSLINVTPRKTEAGDSDTDLVEIVDIWPVNMQGYLKRVSDKKENRGGSPRDGGVGRHATEGGSPRDHKEEPLKKNTPEELFVAETPVGSPPSKIDVLTKTGTLSLDESVIYLKIVQQNVDWSADEIRYARNALAKYAGIVNNWWSFLEGTVVKFRNSVKSKRAAGQQTCSSKHKSQRKEKGSCSINIPEQNFSRSSSLASDTSGPPSPTLVCLGDLLKV